MGSLFSKSFVSDPSQFATASTSDDPAEWKQYDYIVVGGGSAGCVVASRLSEDPNVTVLLIEAGKSEGNVLTHMPLAFTKSYRSEVDWAYTTVPQKAMGGKEIYWARGKLLGGTSVLNACIYHRSSPEDFDSWAKAGSTGWSFNDLEPYFRKLEGFSSSRQLPGVSLEDKGQTGPWKIGYDEGAAPIGAKIIESCKAVGIPYLADINNKDTLLGVGRLPGFVDDQGRRSSTYTAYLPPSVLARPNLTVAINTTVEKVLFSQSSDPLKATGVQVTTSPSAPSYRVAAKKEIILSGGVVGSTQILLLSGVGPKEELESVGVKCVKDLQDVGRHLSDHVSGGPTIFRAKSGTIDHLNSPLSGAPALIKWLLTGKGPFSKMPVGSAAFMRSDDPKLFDTSLGTVKDLTSGPKSPDLEFMITPAIVPDFFSSGPPGMCGITVASIALKPESEGTIKLKTDSIWDKPLIDGNYLSSESDVNVILRGVRLLFRIAHTEPLKDFLDLRPESADKSSYFWPADADPDKLTDDELREWILRNGHPACHPVGTCRMGPSPTSSVVSPELKVHGITGLRIVDASVFPTQVSGHPCAPIVAMAEKLSDMIKEEHKVAQSA